ncbi:MAG: flagellum-specific ATP synthase FliI, partial [Desulfovibrionaceae bacterium]|nr:flagellum-specific ATP synthase FliI [Desulfovibrionaceae bacterium]
MSPDPRQTMDLLRGIDPLLRYGKVNKVVGLVAEGSGLSAPLGSLCHILPHGEKGEEIPAEVVGFREGNLLFMPYGDLRGVRPGSLIRNSSLPPFFPVGPGLLGRAFDAFGEPLEGLEALKDMGAESAPLQDRPALAPIYAEPPSPLSRP